MRISLRALTLAIALLGFTSMVSAAEPYEVKVETNVTVKMRDGVLLSADIYRPRAEGKFPVILERTPYDKHSGIGLGLKAAARGYVYIAQDVRGRWASSGDWYPFKYESQDGYDSVEWAAALPYSNGKVGLWGGSYVGATQMLAAIAAPPHLAGLMPVVTASDYHSHWAYQGGAFMQLLAQAWSSALSLDGLQRRAAASALPSYWDMTKSPSAYPLLEVGTSAGLANYYFDWIAHPAYDDYWKQWSIEGHFDQIKVPALHVAAWYDLFQDGSIRNYIGIKQHGGTEAARNGQRLIIMPGGHAGNTAKIGEVDFGKDSTVDTWALGLRWYDYLLKGINNGMETEKPVRVFVMGKNVWREEDDWPLPRAKTTRYYLHSQGKANSLNGDGLLNTTAPTQEPADKYVFDPADPTPTHGGPILGDTAHYPPGPLDQAKVESRPDVLVYTTPAFEQNTEISGPITLELYVSSSALDTDFMAKVVDVWPNGFAMNLTDGVLRARYRNSMEKPELMKLGEVYKLTINVWATANVFLAGHKLRLEIASANFPRFDRNPNTGENPEKATSHIKATNTIYHDQRRPSALILPVVP
ncbi:MAG TPA: CocE/NonD family hydrolase [Blastocatellia bacterium]|nr:CocE/NonD family hydrolase [Blastocatellia bacterium]